MGLTTRWGIGVVALVVGITGALAVPRADAAAVAYSTTQTYIASSDGVRLHTVVFRPAGVARGSKVPVVLSVSPYATSGITPLGSKDPAADPTPRAGGFEQELLARGYAFVEVALRGYGASTGCFDEGGLGEQADVQHAVEWAASQTWSTGKVGMVGHSYDGQTQLMALGTHPKGLAAVIPSSAPAGYANFYSDGVGNVSGQGFGAFYLASDLLPPSLQAPPSQLLDALTEAQADPTCYLRTELGTLDDRPTSAYWQDRDLAAKAAGSTVPVLMEQGFDDFNVRSTDFSEVWPRLAGPKRAVLGPWDHNLGHTTGRGLDDERLRWLDAYVKGDPAALAYERSAPPVIVQTPDGRYRAEQSWPPADVAGRTFPILGGTYLDAPGNSSETRVPPVVPGALGIDDLPVDLPTGKGSWTFSPPLDAPMHLAGRATAAVHLRALVPRTTLIALLYDIDPRGAAHFVARGAHLTGRAGAQVATVTVYPHDWVFAKGHRVGLLLTGSDSVWFTPGVTGTPVRILGGTLTVPALTQPRSAFLPGGPYDVLPPSPPFTVSARKIERRTG